MIAMAVGPLSGKFEDAQENDPGDYLPGGAESVLALEEVQKLEEGNPADAISVFRRDQGLTPEDERAIAKRLIESGEPGEAWADYCLVLWNLNRFLYVE